MASTVRTIVVLPKCSVGEFLCQDEKSCSVDRVCLGDDVSSDNGGGSEEDPSAQALTLTLVGPSIMRVKQARIRPALWPCSHLMPIHNELASHVRFPCIVQQMRPFESCQPGQEPTEDVPCDPGVVAMDAAGADLSTTALALPVGVLPGDCLTTDCSPYRIRAKGLQVTYGTNPGPW